MVFKDSYSVRQKKLILIKYFRYGGGPVITKKCILESGRLCVDVVKTNIKVVWSREPKKVVEKSIDKSITLLEFMIEMSKEMKFNVKKIKVLDFFQYHKGELATKLVRYVILLFFVHVIFNHLFSFSFFQTYPLNSTHNLKLFENNLVLIEEQRKDGTIPGMEAYPSQPTYNYSSYTSTRTSPPGQTGLTNLGNTCFMNSALQCLASTAPLTDFFLKNTYKKDINEVNALGIHNHFDF